MPKPNRVSFRVNDPGVIVEEYLRYAGAVGVTNDAHTGYVPRDVEAELGGREHGQTILTMYCPPKTLGDIWARHQVERLASFGVKAVSWYQRQE